MKLNNSEIEKLTTDVEQIIDMHASNDNRKFLVINHNMDNLQGTVYDVLKDETYMITAFSYDIDKITIYLGDKT